MKPFYWTTSHAHWDNNETMNEWISNYNLPENEGYLEITFVDGTYAEGVNKQGDTYEIHARGAGDSYSHIIEFVYLAKTPTKEGAA